MSKNEPASFESPDSAAYADEPSPRINPASLPAGATVLETAIENDRFRDGGCTVVCPGCGDPAETYPDGLPQIYFAEQCESCDVGLRRWSAVVVPSIQPPVLPGDELQELVETYWEQQFREGVETDGLPHTREFGDECERLASQWGWDWEVTCPLCSRSLDELGSDYLGYHHWSYDPDVGTSLCTSCHDYIHGANSNGHSQSAANRQDWRARQLGLRDFQDLAVIRLSIRHRHTHDDDRAEDPEFLKERYNVPLSEDRIRPLLTDVRHRDPVNDAILENGGSPTVDGPRARAKQ